MSIVCNNCKLVTCRLLLLLIAMFSLLEDRSGAVKSRGFVSLVFKFEFIFTHIEVYCFIKNTLHNSKRYYCTQIICNFFTLHAFTPVFYQVLVVIQVFFGEVFILHFKQDYLYIYEGLISLFIIPVDNR